MSVFDAFATMAANSQNVLAQREANEQNIAFQREVNEQNIAFQREINDTNYQRQLEMWEKTNAYNHPAEQMKRYKEAGLNPNLIYGQSNTAQSANVATGSAVKLDAPSVQPAMRQKLTFGNVGHDFLNGLYRMEEVHNLKLDNEIKEQTKDDIIMKSYYEAQRQGVQLANDLIKNNNDNLELALKTIELEINEYTKQNRKDLSDISVNQANVNVSKTKAETNKINAETNKINAETDNLIAQKKVIQWQAAVTYMESLLKSAQFEHETKKIGLTEKEIAKVEEQINLIKTQISNIAKDTDIKGLTYDEKFMDNNNPLSDLPVIGRFSKGVSKTLLGVFKALGINY